MQNIKKIANKIVLYTIIILFYFGLLNFVRFLHKKYRIYTALSLFVKETKNPSFYYEKLPGKIIRIQKEKTEKKISKIVTPIKKIEYKDDETIVTKNDTLINITSAHYGKYDDKIGNIVKNANKNIDFSKLAIGQKIILPFIPELQKENISEPQTPQEKIIENKILIIDPIEITKINILYDDKWIYIDGEIFNKSEKNISFIKFNIDFLDNKDKIIYSDFIYITKKDELKIGKTKSFELMTKYLTKIKKYQVWLEYY